MSDRDLLQQYVSNGSQAAFTELVERHVGLVFSAANRMLRDRHRAEDVTQDVFALLARKAHRLSKGAIISAWLYRAARNLTLETLRRDARWRQRERLAIESMNYNGSDLNRSEVEPFLDEAMAELSCSDHDAIVLRYFENKTLREVAANLGASEGAAQKRVSRALERLRIGLARRGVTTTASALATFVSTAAIQETPFGVATMAASIVLATSGTHTPIFSELFVSLNVKSIAAAIVIGLLSVSTFIVGWQNAALRRQSELSRVQTLPNQQQVHPGAQDAAESRRIAKEHLELLALRGQVAQLRKELRELKSQAVAQKEMGDSQEHLADSILFTVSLTNHVSDGQTLVTGGWSRDGERGYLFLTPKIDASVAEQASPKITVFSKTAHAPESFWNEIGWTSYKSDSHRSCLSGVLAPEHVERLFGLLKQAKADFSNDSTTTVNAGEKVSLGWSVSDDESMETLMMVDVYPAIGADGKSVDIAMSPTPIPDNLGLRKPISGSTTAGR